MLRDYTTLSYYGYECQVLFYDDEDPDLYQGIITNAPELPVEVFNRGPYSSTSLVRLSDWFHKEVDHYIKYCSDKHLLPSYKDVNPSEVEEAVVEEKEKGPKYKETAIIKGTDIPYDYNLAINFLMGDYNQEDSSNTVVDMWKDEISKIFSPDPHKAVYTKEYVEFTHEYRDIISKANSDIREAVQKVLNSLDKNIMYSYEYHTKVISLLTQCSVYPHIEIKLLTDTEQSESPDKEIKMSYKGYDALIKGYEDGAYCGVVKGDKIGKDLVIFEADSFDDIWKEFVAAVDDYIDMKEDIKYGK